MNRTIFSLVSASGLALLSIVSCGKDHTSPTEPSANPSPTPGVGTTATVPPAVTRTPTAAATPTPASTAHMVAVGQSGTAFTDSQSGTSTTTIRAGETVQWNWVGAFHSSTSGNCCTPSGVWDSGAMSTGSFSHTFPATGTFPYFCTIHGSMMTGVVMVN